MITKKCLWCEDDNLKIVAKRIDDTDILMCKSCGLHMVSQMPDILEDYYDEALYFNKDIEKKEGGIGYFCNYDLISPLFFYWQKSIIEELIHEMQGISFLEIGCATGNLLEILNENSENYNIIKGIDVSKFAVKIGKSKGLDVENSTIENFRSQNKFDVIFSAETMEHVGNLKDYLTGVRKNLKENGIFVFYIPAIKETMVSFENKNYAPFNTSLEHTMYFTNKFLKREFENFFNKEVSIFEFDNGNENSILGIIGSSKTQGKLCSVLKYIMDDHNNVEKLNVSDYYNATIIAAKFAKNAKAENFFNKIKDNLNNTKADFLEGIIRYHVGESYEARRLFLKSFGLETLDNFKLKILYAIERDLVNYYERNERMQFLDKCKKYILNYLKKIKVKLK